MGQFLERYNVQKLTQEEIDNPNRPLSIWEIKKLIIIFPNKTPGPDVFTSEFDQTFKEDMIPVLCNLFQKIGAERVLPDSFYKANTTLIPKPKTFQ